MAAQTTYAPGSVTTATGASPAFPTLALPQGLDLADLYLRLLAAQRPRDVPRSPFGSAPRGVAPVARGPRRDVLTGQDPMEAQAQQSALQALIARNQALMSPPPTRMTTFASGANNAYMPDVLAMNAYQREAFLPDEARGGIMPGLEGGGGSGRVPIYEEGDEYIMGYDREGKPVRGRRRGAQIGGRLV